MSSDDTEKVCDCKLVDEGSMDCILVGLYTLYMAHRQKQGS